MSPSEFVDSPTELAEAERGAELRASWERDQAHRCTAPFTSWRDRPFLFGFSRSAHTTWRLAGTLKGENRMSDQGRPSAAGGFWIAGGTLLLVLTVGALASHHPLWLIAVIALAVVASGAIARKEELDERNALAVAAGLGGAALAALSWWWIDAKLGYWIIAATAGTWLLISLLVGKMLPARSDPVSKEGYLSWLSNHKAVAGSAAVAYLSLTGLVYEATFYSKLGLSALRYVDPGSLVYAIFSQWALAVVALGNAFVLLWVPWLLRRLGTLPKWGGRVSHHVRNRDWTALPVWILGIPARYFVLVRGFLIVVATIAFTLVPVGVADFAAELAYDGIPNERKGTLQLSRPAVSAAGVRHVASTSTHMILAYRCGAATPDQRSGGPQEEVWKALLTDMSEHIKEVSQRTIQRLKLWQPNIDEKENKDTVIWLPVVVPWTVVASFDLENAIEAASAGDGRVSKETDVTDSDDCSAPWSPALPPSGSPGPAGPKGDSVSVQYSSDGSVEGEWLDDPTPDIRYIRFKVGDGEWRPLGGVRIAGSMELWYGVPFNRFTLTEDVKSQLAFTSILPHMPEIGTGRTCRIEVRGCASDTPFFHWCSDRTGSTQCTRCEGDDAACHPMMARFDEETGVATYFAAEPLLKGVLATSDGDLACHGLQCVEKANDVLNCGVANLRSLAAAAQLPSTPSLDAMLDNFDLRLPNGTGGGPAAYIPRVGELLVAGCSKVVDGPTSGNVTLRAARPIPGGSQCWTPLETRLNHAAIIRLDGGRTDTIGGCLQTVRSRA